MSDDFSRTSQADFEWQLGRCGQAFEELARLLDQADEPMHGPGIGAIVGILADRLHDVQTQLVFAIEAARAAVAAGGVGDALQSLCERAATGASATGGKVARIDGLEAGSLAAALRDAGLA